MNALAICTVLNTSTKGPAGTPWQGQGKVEKKRTWADSSNLLMAPPEAFFGTGDHQGPVFDCSQNLKFYIKIETGD